MSNELFTVYMSSHTLHSITKLYKGLNEQLHLTWYFLIFTCKTLVLSRLFTRQVMLFFYSDTEQSATTSLKNCTSV